MSRMIPYVRLGTSALLGTRFVRFIPASRFYSQIPKETKTLVEEHWTVKLLPSFLLKKRGYASNSFISESGEIRERNFPVDFQEDITTDYHVPLAEFERVSNENGELRAELKRVKRSLDRILIPIVVRDYAQMIKKRFPGIEFSPPPAELSSKLTDTEKFIVREKYRWYEILKQGSSDMYVSLVIQHLEDAFRKKENIPIIENKHLKKFDEFKLMLCESIAEGVDYGNKLVAHRSGQMILKERLNVCDNAVDPFLTIFYNALVGKVEDED